MLAHGRLHNCYSLDKFDPKPDAAGKLARAARSDAIVVACPPARRHRAQLAVPEAEGIGMGLDGVKVLLCPFTIGVSQRAVAKEAKEAKFKVCLIDGMRHNVSRDSESPNAQQFTLVGHQNRSRRLTAMPNWLRTCIEKIATR